MKKICEWPFLHGKGVSKSYGRSLQKTAAPLRVNFRKIRGVDNFILLEFAENGIMKI